MDNFDEKRLLSVLERIATAFEAQNRMNAEWIALQTKWREEDKAHHETRIHTDQRLTAIQEENLGLYRWWVGAHRLAWEMAEQAVAQHETAPLHGESSQSVQRSGIQNATDGR